MSEVIIERHYYNNSKNIWCEIPTIDGKWHGIKKTYHPSGTIYSCVSFNHGQNHGLYKVYTYDNHPGYESYYIHGNLVSEKEWRKHELITQLADLG